jgi:hypothetical protein
MTMINNWIGKLFGRAVGCPCHEDLFDFALDGLDNKDQAGVRRHLADCPHCRDQVKDYAWVSEGIALSAPQVDPPAGICDKVKERIRAESSGAPVLTLGRDPLAGWPRFWMRLGPVFALGSLVMTALAFFAVFSRPQPPAALQGTADFLSSSATKQVALAGQGEAKDSSGRLYFAPGSDELLVNVQHLEPCSRGRVYTLWSCPQGQKPSRLAGFQTEDGRSSLYVLHLAKPLALDAKATDFQVTLEDSGKDPQLQKGPLRLLGRYNL